MKNLAPEQIGSCKPHSNARILSAGLRRELPPRAEIRSSKRQRWPRRHVAITHSDMLRMALKDSAARRHFQINREAEPL